MGDYGVFSRWAALAHSGQTPPGQPYRQYPISEPISFMIEIVRVFVLMTSSFVTGQWITDSNLRWWRCSRELNFGEQDPSPAVRSRVPTRLRAS